MSGAPQRKALPERDLAWLLARVEFDTNGGCWLFSGGGHEYGNVVIDGRQVVAHRVSWALHRGEIPVGLIVRHKCDTPRCVNPDHLELGTYKDNTADMWRRGRAVFGHAPSAKLSEEQVIEIRRRRAAGETYRSIASAFGIRHSTCRDVARGVSYRHVEAA